MAAYTVRVIGPDGADTLQSNVGSTSFKDGALTCLLNDGQVMQFGPFPPEMITGPTPTAEVLDAGAVIATYELVEPAAA